MKYLHLIYLTLLLWGAGICVATAQPKATTGENKPPELTNAQKIERAKKAKEQEGLNTLATEVVDEDVKRDAEILSEKAKELSQEAEQTEQAKDDLTKKAKELSQEAEQTEQAKDDLTKKAKELSQEAEQTEQVKDDLTKKAKELSQEAEQTEQVKDDLTKKTKELSQGTRDLSEATQKILKDAEAKGMPLDENIKKVLEQAKEVSKKAKEVSDTADDAAQSVSEASRKVKEASDTADDAAQSVSEASRKAKEASDTADDAAQSVSEASNKAKEVSDTADDAAKEAGELSKQAGELSEQADDVSEKVQEDSTSLDETLSASSTEGLKKIYLRKEWEKRITALKHDLKLLKERLDTISPEVLANPFNALYSEKIDVQMDALAVIVYSDKQDPSWHVQLAEFIESLSGDSSSEGLIIRNLAILALTWFKTPNPDIQHVLIDVILEYKDENEYTKKVTVEIPKSAAFALGFSPVHDEQVINQLIKIALQNPNASVRSSAMSSLRFLDVDDPKYYKKLEKGLSDPFDLVNTYTVQLLAGVYVNTKDEWVFQKIIKALSSTTVSVRKMALKALIKINYIIPNFDVKKITPYIIDSLEDSDTGIKSIAMSAVSKLQLNDLKTIRTVMKELLQTTNATQNKVLFITSLGDLQVKSNWINNNLLTFLEDASAEIRMATVKTYKKIKPKSSKIHIKLIDRLLDADPKIQWATIWAIDSIRPTSNKFYNKLADKLSQLDPYIRVATLQFLQRSKVKNTKITTALSQLVSNKEDQQQNPDEIRLEALKALKNMDWYKSTSEEVATEEQKKDIKNELVKALEDSNPEVRKAAASALNEAGVLSLELLKYNALCILANKWC